MQPHALTLIALLAPLPAAAFGDLDCITVETCGNGGCGPASGPRAGVFAITFDWPRQTATIDIDIEGDAQSVTLPWAATNDDDDSPGTVLDYAAPDTADQTLRIIADGADITAFYTFNRYGVETWVGTCDVRRAA